jgi:hypothetical protein
VLHLEKSLAEMKESLRLAEKKVKKRDKKLARKEEENEVNLR